MVRYELQRLPGAPLQRGTVDAGTTLVTLLDSLQLHRDLVVKLNGRALPDDYDISRPLCTGDVVAVFDQPEGGVGKLVTTILRPVSKILSGALKVFGLSNKPSASVSVATGESPNNDLTGQTNRARLYKGRPNIYGQCRVFPDLIQEALFEFVDNNKQLTEWFEVGYGRYTISSIRYSESNLGSLAGASSAIYNPGDVIGTIEVGYQFDDVDNETVPGLNESQDFPAQTATTTAPTLVAIESNQLKAVVLSNDDNFAYFAALAVPHPVTFVINATWNDGGTSVTRNVTGAGNIISSESFIGENTLSYTTFYIGELSGEITSLPGNAVINPTLFTLNDQTPLVIGPSVSPIVSRQVWVHVLVQLGATAGTTQYRIKFWKVDDDNNQVPGTSEQYDYFFDNDFQVTTRYFRTTHKFTPAAGAGRYAVTIERLDNSNDANVVTLMAIHAVNVRENVVYSRLTMTVKVLEETQVVRGTVVQCPDMYDNAQQTGYINGRSGDVFSTSERIDFSLGDMWVVMTDSLGNYRGRWRAYPVSGKAKAFQAAADTFDLNIYDRSTVQNPSRYFIATDSELNSTIWRVDSAKPNGDDTQTLSLTEYSDSIYP